MSQIDWSKAPAHATHWCPGNAKIEAGWIYATSGGEFYSCYADKGLEHIPGFPAWRALRLTPRPAESSEWTGEGLPPVGTVCEFAGFNPEETLPTDPRVGDQVTVIAHFMSGSLEVAAFTFHAPPEFEYLQVAQGAYGCFRQIRTPEQIAAEERLAAIKEMASAAHRPGQISVTKLEMAERLYDAGYRKQVAP